ncbi:hypothetical protein HDC37_001839 [Microbacterium sp. AK009]|nr:hypothetical protein [Microbacterium sp. AK009]
MGFPSFCSRIATYRLTQREARPAGESETADSHRIDSGSPRHSALTAATNELKAASELEKSLQSGFTQRVMRGAGTH